MYRTNVSNLTIINLFIKDPILGLPQYRIFSHYSSYFLLFYADRKNTGILATQAGIRDVRSARYLHRKISRLRLSRTESRQLKEGKTNNKQTKNYLS